MNKSEIENPKSEIKNIRNPQSITWISNLRLVSLFAVIVLHTNSVLLAKYPGAPLADWLTADVFNALVRFAVPAFVMITGSLLLHREYELGDFLKRRLGRVITPFLFWSLIYVGYSYFNSELTFNGNAWQVIRQILHQLKYGSSYHLWYVYMLIGLYLIIPIISKFVQRANEKELLYFLAVWFGVMLLEQPWLSRYKPQVEFRYFEGYIGYLVLGHYLTFKHFGIKQIRAMMLVAFLIMVVVISAGTWWMTSRQHSISTVFFEPVGPFVVLLSVAIFLFFKNSNVRLPRFYTRFRDFTGTYAFGIYLAHALVLYILDDFGNLMSDVFENFPDTISISYKLCTPVISIPVTAILCLAITLPLVWALSKVPVVGKYIAG